MKQGGHDSQLRPTNPVVATSQREMCEQLPPPSTSAGLQRRAKELPQVRRPPTGTGGSPPLVRIADTPNVSGLSGGGGRRGFPRHRLTTSTRASGTPVPSTTSASRPISELAGVLEFLPRNVAESPSTRTKRLPLGPKEVTREHLFDFREEFSGQLLESESQEKKSDISMRCETRGRFYPLSKPENLTQEQPAAVNPRLVPTPQKVVSSEERQRVLPRTSTTTPTTTTRRIDVPRHIRNSADTSLPRLPPDIESRVPAASRLTLPKPGIRRKPEQDAGQVMGDVACYGVWKTEIEVCTTANSQRRTYNEGVPARTGSSTTLLEDSREDELTGKRRRSELVSSKTTGMFQNPSKKLQPDEFTGSSEMALIGGFEDLSGGTYVLPDDHALELTVDITQRQRASAVAPSEGSSSLSSFKKRVSAAVTVHRGTRPVNIKPQQARLEPIFSEPSKAPEEPPVREPQPKRNETLKKPQKPKEPDNDVEYGWPVDYERFLPHSREALSYTELLEYPKQPRKASTKRDVSLSQLEAQDEQGVSPPMEEFVLDSAPVVPSTRRVSASKPIGPSKGKAAPQADKKPTSKAASRHSRGSLDGVNQEQATSAPHTKQVENKVGKNQRRSSTPKSPSTDRGEDISAPLTSKGSDVSSMKGSATSHSPRRRSIAAEESKPTVSSSRRISSLIPTPPSATKNVDKKEEMTQKQSPAPESPKLAHDEDIPSRSLSQGRGAPSQKGFPELDSQDRRSTADPQQKPTTSSARRASPSKPIGPSNRQTTPPTAAKQVGKKAEETEPRASSLQSPKTAHSVDSLPRSSSEERVECFTHTLKDVRPPDSPGRRRIAVRPFAASFHKEADAALCLPRSCIATAPDSRAPEESTPAKQPATICREVRGIPARPFISRVDIPNDDHPPRELPPPPQVCPLPRLQETTSSNRYSPKQQLAKGTRPFKASVHDTTAGIKKNLRDAMPLITVKQLAVPFAKASEKTSTTMPFLAGVTTRLRSGVDAHSCSQGTQPSLRYPPASEGEAAAASVIRASGRIHPFTDGVNAAGQLKEERIGKVTSSTQKEAHGPPKAATTAPPEAPKQPLPSKATAPSCDVRLLEMSTINKAFDERMLWDYSPKPPPKMPHLQAKQTPATETSPRLPITEPSKMEKDGIQKPATHGNEVFQEAISTPAMAAAPQPDPPTAMAYKETSQAPLPDKGFMPQPTTPTAKVYKEALLPSAGAFVSQPTTAPAKTPKETAPASAHARVGPTSLAPTTEVLKEAILSSTVEIIPQAATPSTKASKEVAPEPAKQATTQPTAPTAKVSKETGIPSAAEATPQVAVPNEKPTGVQPHEPPQTSRKQNAEIQKIDAGEERQETSGQLNASERSKASVGNEYVPSVLHEKSTSVAPERRSLPSLATDGPTKYRLYSISFGPRARQRVAHTPLALVPAKTAVGHPTVPQLQAGTKKADPETGGPRDSSHILDTSKTPSAVKAAQAADVSKAFLAPEAGTESQINKEEAGSAARLLTTEEKARHATNQAQTAEREESLLKTHTLFFRSPLVSPESPPGTRGALLASAAASADQPDSKTSPKLAPPSQPSNSVGPPATAAQSATTIATKAGTPAGKDTKQPSSFSHSKLLAVATDTDARAVAATSPASVQPAATEPVATRLYILGYRSPSRLSLASIPEQVATPVPVTKASELTLKEKETSLPKGETEASSPPRDVTAAIAIRKTSSEVMHKARGIHKCDKHRNETEAEYERRKARAKAKAKEKAEAEEEKQTSDVKGRSRKSWKGEASMTKPLIRDKSESPAMKKGQLSPEKFRPGVASDHYVKGQTRQSPLCCIIVLVLLIIFLILLLVLWLKKEPEETTSSVSPTTHPILKIYYCSSDVCNAEAAYLKSLISKSIKPCDNFYEYVCEGWTKSHAIPGEGAGAGLSMDTLLQDRFASDVEPTLLGIPDADVKTAAALHEDCMRRDKVGQDGDTVVNVARELFQAWAIKEWPIFKGKTITQSTAWLFAGELVRDLNVAALATVGVGVSPKVLEATAIELDEPRLVFSCNDASRPAVTKLFKDALMEVMSRFAAASATIGSGDVDDVLGVFTRLASSPAIAASPDTSPLVYTNVKLIELDTGFKNFLEGVFNSIVTIDGTTEVVLKSPDYLRNHLPAAMQELSPHAVVNYLGFMALVKAAPFFPERFSNLRQIFGKDVLGRTLPDVSQTKTLCLLAVQQVLPACFAKAAVKLRGMSRTDLPLTEWLSRLESSFGRHQERVAWINELSALIVRYRLKRNRRVAFSSRHEPCAPSPQEIPRRSEHPLRFFHQVSMLQEQKRLQLVLKTGQEVLALRGEARSELATIPEYDVMRQAVHVPMALFNTSVASNTTMFSFHLSRVAVRLYRALVQILFPRNIYERDAPLALTDETLRRLDELLSCFEKDLRVLPAALRGPVSVDSAKFRGALLQHAAAVKLGFRAFRDHLTVRRVWQVDFRFKDLPEFSSDALFFLYYALDNCESADTVYAEHRGTWMPAHYRVNAALRHVKEFAEPFSCSDGDQMALSAQMCHVLKKD